MRISAGIEPNADNRHLAVVADGEEFYRSSEIQLNGAEAPRAIELRFSSLPAGDYQIAAALIDSGEHVRANVRQTARILPSMSRLTPPTPPSLLAFMNLRHFSDGFDATACSSKPYARRHPAFPSKRIVCTS